MEEARAKEIIQGIMDFIVEERTRLAPEVQNEDLTDNGSVYYMNGNDGTDFDFNTNGRTCEFMQFYKSTELGCVKVYLTENGIITGYLWRNEGRGGGISLSDKKLTDMCEAVEFAEYLQENYDDKDIWDAPIIIEG